MNVVIIEDESLMADNLEQEISNADHSISIQAKLESIAEALDYFKKNELPDLFFSDIELTDGLSFEIFEKIESKVPVIFCTAYDHYALGAFKANGIDYILKPYNPEKISQTLEKYKTLIKAKSEFSKAFENAINSFKRFNEETRNRSILVQKGEKIIPIKVAEVALGHIENGITYIYTTKSEKYYTNYKMDTLESMLGINFFRANRQVIICRDYVNHVTPYFARKLLVTPKIEFPEQVIISKANSSKFLNWLEKGL